MGRSPGPASTMHTRIPLGSEEAMKTPTDHPAIHSKRMRYLEVYFEAYSEDRGLDQQLPSKDIGI